MKKKLIAIIAMACVAAFVLSACGGGNNPAPQGSGSAAPQGGTAAAETYDVGDFTISVPSGWKAFPQSDIFGEKDADGNYPAYTDQIVIAKGATDDLSALTSPSVRVYQYKTDSYFALDPSSIYDNVKNLEGVKVAGTDCKGCEFETMGYVYQQITREAGDYTYEYVILKSSDGKDTGLTYEEPDVVTIMESVAAK